MGGGEAGVVSEESGPGGEGKPLWFLCFVKSVFDVEHRDSKHVDVNECDMIIISAEEETTPWQYYTSCLHSSEQLENTQ